MALEFDVNAPGSTLKERALALVLAVAAKEQDALRDLAARVLEQCASWIDVDGHALLNALELDGLVYREGRLVPTTPAPLALEPEISALERDLATLRHTVTARHYRQAVDSFVLGNFEAANGQIRSTVEAFLITLGSTVADRTFAEPSSALQHLRNGKWIDDAEWNQLRGFWDGIQDSGPHAGLTSHHEALYRLHVATAVMRYLLAKGAGQSSS